MKYQLPIKKTLLASALALAALSLVGCQAEGDISESGGITGGSSGGASSGGTGGGLLPNDGSVETSITEGGTPLAGNFICTAGAKAYGPSPTTEVVVNGLVGSAVSDLLNLLGATSVTALLNSVQGKELVVDGNLDTAASYNLTVGLLGGLISSIDLLVGLNGTAPIGKYAVFGLSFPTGTVELSLLQSVNITTFLGTTEQETVSVDATSIDLLGQVTTGAPNAFIGMKVTKPYNSVSISLTPTAISADIGEAMKVHELCTDGNFVAAP
ncbi:MAG: hypothetical protein Q8Q73_16020 [Stagnimonas sp.]|nr:hypothetical protein [Stagnimonas sp.]